MNDGGRSAIEIHGEKARDPRMRGLLTTRLMTLVELIRRSGMIHNRRELGLSLVEWRVLARLGERAPLSLTDLAEQVHLDRGQASRTVKALVERGLISRARAGGPALVISLTEAGKAMYGRMIEVIRERHRFLVEDLHPDDIERMAQLLDSITGRARLLLQREIEVGQPPAR